MKTKDLNLIHYYTAKRKHAIANGQIQKGKDYRNIINGLMRNGYRQGTEQEQVKRSGRY